MTLIEVLIAGAMGGVLLTALTVSSGMFLDSYSTGVNEQNLSLDHHMALDRMLGAIADSETLLVQSSNSILATFPDASTEQYSWSGVQGDSLTLSVDGGAANPVIDGVTNLSFTAIMAGSYEEVLETDHEDLLDFVSYPGGYTQGTEDHTLATGSLHGLVFSVYGDEKVEKMLLTEIELLVGRLAIQTADLKVTLQESVLEWVPRPWMDEIASVTIPNGDIPLAYYSGPDLVIDWMSIPLTADFEIQPNRYYSILVEPVNGAEAGTLRVANVTSGLGPVNSMVYVGSTDGGTTWDPTFAYGEYTLKDTPVHIDGDVYTKGETPIVFVDSVEVDFGISCGGKSASGSGKTKVRGGGEK